jgi:hypothetical protein
MLTRTAFDPEMISLLSAALDQAFKALPPDDQSDKQKTLLGSKIMRAATSGERDPVRLRAAALVSAPMRTIKQPQPSALPAHLLREGNPTPGG